MKESIYCWPGIGRCNALRWKSSQLYAAKIFVVSSPGVKLSLNLVDELNLFILIPLRCSGNLLPGNCDFRDLHASLRFWSWRNRAKNINLLNRMCGSADCCISSNANMRGLIRSKRLASPTKYTFSHAFLKRNQALHFESVSFT